MDCTDIEKALAGTNPPALRRVQGRRVKVHVASLEKNFYLKNPFGRRLSTAVLVRLKRNGITSGWKEGAEIWPHDVHLLEIGLMKLAHSRIGVTSNSASPKRL